MIGKWIRILYMIVAWLFPVAILIQVFLAGLSKSGASISSLGATGQVF